MKKTKIELARDKAEFRRFTDFFIKYLNGSKSSDEAFLRTASTYRKLFKKIPYKSSQRYLAEFKNSEYSRIAV